jgi:GT2 family glycosyltransferase
MFRFLNSRRSLQNKNVRAYTKYLMQNGLKYIRYSSHLKMILRIFRKIWEDGEVECTTHQGTFHMISSIEEHNKDAKELHETPVTSHFTK